MAEITSAELLKRLRSGEHGQIWYIYGADVAEVEKVTSAVMKKYLGSNWRSEASKMDGQNLDPLYFADTAEMSTLFTEYNVILVNDLDCDALRQEVFERIFSTVETVPEQTVLVFNITGFDVKGGKKFFSGKNKKLVDYIAKNGIVCCCAKKTAYELSKSIVTRVQKKGCSISQPNAELLASFCLADTLQIDNEIEKLCSYRENSDIRREDIELLVPGQIETDSFRLADAIITQNAKQSFVIMDELLIKYDSALMILSAVSITFIDLYRAKSALSAGKYTKDVVNDFAYGKRSFAVDKAFRSCRKISDENIVKCIKVLRNTDRRLKRISDRVAVKTEMEKLLTQLLMAAKNG